MQPYTTSILSQMQPFSACPQVHNAGPGCQTKYRSAIYVELWSEYRSPLLSGGKLGPKNGRPACDHYCTEGQQIVHI